MLGDRDLVYFFPGVQQLIARLRDHVPGLVGSHVLEGCGHWTQQERPAEVSRLLCGFLDTLST